MKQFFQSLTFKIGVAILSFQIIGLTIIGTILIGKFSAKIDAHLEEHLEGPNRLLARGLLEYCCIEDRDLMKGLIGEEPIESMMIGAQGEVLHSLNPEYRGKNIAALPELNHLRLSDANTDIAFSWARENDQEYLSSVFMLDPSTLVYFKISSNKARRQKTMVRNVFLIGSTSSLIVVSIIILLFFYLMVAKHLNHNLKMLQQVEQGDYAVPPSCSYTSDEFGKLQAGIHSMIARLDERERERKAAVNSLQETHSDLEKRVLERTEELEAANEKLQTEMIERERSEEALRRSERLASIGTLAAGIAHEINNPLGGILLAAELASLAQDKPEILSQSLAEIIAQTRRCGRIVKSVMQFSRQETSRKMPGNINDIISNSSELIRSYAEKKSARLSLELEEGLAPVLMNDTEIGQIIINLVNNAAQAEARSIVLRTRNNDEYVYLEIEDDGTGIEPEEQKQVFDPFFTTRHEQGGMGLGLSITHGIITGHGGQVDLRSQPAKGTHITISLPVVDLEDGSPGSSGAE